MTKRNLFATLAALCVALTFFSCEQLSEQGASISIALPKELGDALARYAAPRDAMSRQAADADGGASVIRISLSGGVERTEDFAWNNESRLTCTMVNLPVGATVTVDVSAWVDGVKRYKTKNPPNVTLTEGPNATSVMLTPAALSVTITIDNATASIDDIRALSDGGQHTVAVTGPLDNAALRNIASAIKAIPNGTTASLNLSATTGLTSIGDAAFIGCTALASVTIPNSVTSIGDAAFGDCAALTGITIPASVTSIGREAFNGCTALTGITIPASVTSIGLEAFINCKSLETITVAEGNKTYGSGNGCNAIIETATNTLVAGCKNTVIPASVTSIGDSAFWGCTSLASVTFASGSALTSIGGYAFYYCTALTSITIPAAVTSIYLSAFRNCTSLTSITIPANVTSIGEFAFYNCTALAEVTFETTSGWKSNGTDADVSTPTTNAENLKSSDGTWIYGLTRTP